VGGYLLEGHLRPTLELVLTESPVHLRRRYDGRKRAALDSDGISGVFRSKSR